MAEVFSPVGRDKFIIGRSSSRVGIQNCIRGSKGSRKDGERFSQKEEGK